MLVFLHARSRRNSLNNTAKPSYLATSVQKGQASNHQIIRNSCAKTLETISINLPNEGNFGGQWIKWAHVFLKWSSRRFVICVHLFQCESVYRCFSLLFLDCLLCVHVCRLWYSPPWCVSISHRQRTKQLWGNWLSAWHVKVELLLFDKTELHVLYVVSDCSGCKISTPSCLLGKESPLWWWFR